MNSLFSTKTGTLWGCFPHPAPEKKHRHIFAVFIPYAGCPQRCLFCSQHSQTGQNAMPLAVILKKAGQQIAATMKKEDSFELAFFGGTFTALPEPDLSACLAFSQSMRAAYPNMTLRCSTRPDAVHRAILERLQQCGMTTIELGVQSFSDCVLQATQRGYDRLRAQAACRMVKDYGFALGIQLLPGLPGHTQKAAEEDVRQSILLAPDFVRLYPCLVLEGTPLAEMWKRGEFIPWAHNDMREFLAVACLCFWEQGIPVIRIGVAHEEGFEDHVLEGVRHPALGSMVRGEALFQYIQRKVQESGCSSLYLRVPQRYSGEFWGHGRHLETQYCRLGLPPQRVSFWSEPFFCLTDVPAIDRACLPV